MFSLRPQLTRALAVRGFATSTPAADYAKLTLVGRLGADPVLRTNSNGKEYLTYRIATSDPYMPPKDGAPEPEQTTSWHTVFAYGPAVERLSKLEKGTLVYAEASLRIRGEKNEAGEYKTDVFATHERLNVIRKPYKEAAEGAEAETTE